MAIIDKIKAALIEGVLDESEPPGPIADFIKLSVEPILKSTGMTDEVLDQLDPEDATKLIADMTNNIKTMVLELSLLHIDLLIEFVLILAKYIPTIKDDFDEDAAASTSEGSTSEGTTLASDS